MKQRWVSGCIAGVLFATAVMPVAAQRRVADAGASRDADAAVMQRPVTVSLQQIPLRRAISAIAEAGHVNLVYQTQVIDAVDRPITITAKSMPLGEVLNQALAGTRLRAVVIGKDLVNIGPFGAETSFDGVVTGTVVDTATKRPVAGAVVKVDGTKIAVRTDARGAFTLRGVPAGTYSLVVQRLGYRPARKNVVVPERGTVSAELVLSVSSTSLEDVVTTVTGLQRRVEVGNSIGVINADSLVKQAPIATLSDLLTSRVPGLAVRQGQGTVGGDVKLQIRGPSSIRYSDEPIIVIDGIRYNTQSVWRPGNIAGGAGSFYREPVSPLNDLNPNDVERVEVIKGPSAATLYGPDAANGVIVITTKHGKAGPPRWNVYGTQDYTKIPRERLLTDAQYYGWGHRANGTNISTCDIAERLNHRCTFDSLVVKRGINTDKSLSIFKPAYPWAMGANVSGGPQALRYFMGGSYQNAEGAISVPDTILALLRSRGAVLPKDLLRPNGQTMLNLSSNLAASVGTNLDLTISGYYTHANTRSIDANLAPLNTIRQDNINPENGVNELGGSIQNVFSGISEEANDRFVTNATAQFRLTPWLSGTGNVGLDRATREKTEFQERDSTRFLYAGGRAYSGNNTTAVLTGNGSVSATARRGWLSSWTTVGVQYVRQTDNVLESSGEDLIPGTRSVIFAALQYTNLAYQQTITLGSFAEQRMGVNERLFLTAAIRGDGSSTFGERYRAAAYPKLGASWLVSEEPIFPRLPGFTEFRLRGAYGVAGRHPRSTDKLPTLSVATDPTNCYGSSRCLIQTLGNPDLRPEQSREFEGGFDAGLFGARAQLGVTWQHRRTRDLIVSELLPMGMGIRLVNVGLTSQNGFEASLTAKVIETRPASFAVMLNHSSYQTKLVKLGDAQPTYDVNGGYVEGFPLGARFVRKWLGYEDKNGDGMLFQTFNPTLNEIFFGSSDPDSLVYGGVTEPTRRQNLVMTLGLWSDRLRVSANVAREGGGTVITSQCRMCRGRVDSTASLAEQAFARRVANVGTAPVVSATFTRLREVSASFMLPSHTLRMVRATSGSITLSARNLGLWTKTKMIDPESGVIGNGKPGGGNFGVPQSQQWALRFDLGL